MAVTCEQNKTVKITVVGSDGRFVALDLSLIVEDLEEEVDSNAALAAIVVSLSNFGFLLFK